MGGETGRCGAGKKVGFSSALIHPGEEPFLSGQTFSHNEDKIINGSGTIFFTRCNLSCVFCQNHQISQSAQQGQDIEIDQLVEIMFRLAGAGAYNINLVSPTPYAFEIAQALAIAKQKGLKLPVVYNTGGYDSLEALALMEGLVDIYLPDAKIGRAPDADPQEPDARALRLFGARDYCEVNKAALREMKRQVGHLELNSQGLATKGLAVRHLVLPDNLARTDMLLGWLVENLGADLYLSLMAQYFPTNKLAVGYNPEFADMPGLGRPLSVREYERSMNQAWEMGLHNTFTQDLESASKMLPDFTKEEVFN
jgi:putative pyruvate formate lyase activating enzyme